MPFSAYKSKTYPSSRTITIAARAIAACAAIALFLSCAGMRPGSDGPNAAAEGGSAAAGRVSDSAANDTVGAGAIKSAELSKTPAEHPAAILAKRDFNYARIRILADSTADYGLGQDLDYVIRAAKAAKANGMRVLLDIFYSRWWADPGQNWKPETWPNYLPGLETRVYDYTRSVLAAMDAAGALPDMVQVGNEVNNGMLWPAGRLSGTSGAGKTGTSGGWAAFAALSNRGYEAVKSVSADIPVMVQYAGTGRGCVAWYDSFFKNGGKSDVLGLSFYEMWHGTIEDLCGTLATLHKTYGKDLYVVETAAYRKPSEGHYKTRYPHTEEGQYRFLYDLTAALQTVEGVRGLMYWGAAWTQSAKWLVAPDWKDDDAGCRGLFNDDGVATLGVSAFADAGGLECIGADISEAEKAVAGGVRFRDR